MRNAEDKKNVRKTVLMTESLSTVWKLSTPGISPSCLPFSKAQCIVPISSTAITLPLVPEAIGLGSSGILSTQIPVPGGYISL